MKKVYKIKSPLDLIIDDLNTTIYNGDLSDIIEVTYAYTKIGKNKFLNTTLFENFIKNKTKKRKIDFKDLELRVISKLKEKLALIDTFLFELNNLFLLEKSDNIRKNILIKSLEYVKTTLEICSLGLVFELEKAGMKLLLSQDEKKERISQIENLEITIFGPKIESDSLEVTEAYEFLMKNYIKKQSRLNNKEKTFYTGILDRLFSHYNISRSIKSFLKRIFSILNISDKPLEILENQNNYKLLARKLSRKTYITLFKKVFDFYGIHKNVLVDTRSSIYDSDTTLFIPASLDHDFLSVEEVLKLIQHEIESHYLNLENNSILLGDFKGADNLQKEEGLAVFMEKFLLEGKKAIFSTVDNFPRLLVGEMLDGKNYKKFLELDYKLHKKSEYYARFLRNKRNYSLDLPGIQHKDTTYNRGLKKVYQYVREGKDFSKLYLGKVGFDDIENIDSLVETIGIYSKTNIKKPLFIAESLLFLLNGGDVEKINTYLQDKYSVLGFDKTDVKVVDGIKDLEEVILG